MIGRMVRTRSAPLKRMFGAGRDQREGKAERGRADADQHGEEQRVPGDAAAQVRGDAIEPPDRAVEEFRDKFAERERAVIVLQRARQDGGDRKEHEHDRERDDAADRADHEGIAAAPAARRRARSTAASGTPPTVSAAPTPMPAWLGPGAPNSAAEKRPAPAAQPDRKALRDDEREARACPRRRASAPACSAACRATSGHVASSSGNDDRREPPCAAGERETGGAARSAGDKPMSHSNHSPRARCHGSSAKPVQPSASQICAPRLIPHPGVRRAGMRHFGRFFTSLSHLDSRRRRSAEEPYLAKS